MSSDVALRAAPRDRLLGELLLDAGLLGEADLERGLALQEKIGGRLGSVLTVSYTHLDVYKRQALSGGLMSNTKSSVMV